MSESPRIFKLTTPHMTGSDVRAWQQFLADGFREWKIDYPLEADGDYGQATRAATASYMHAWGVASASRAMANGLTPWWRSKLRKQEARSGSEQERFDSSIRSEYRRALSKRYAEDVHLSTPVGVILADSWGWHPGVHDGVDLICNWRAPLLAICDGRIVRVSSSGWWGLGAAPSAGHPVSEGDGIIILECTISAGGLFKPGLHFGYGHAEGAVVGVGDVVKAGDMIGHAGWARAAHVHFMVNDDPPVGGLYRGTGDRDPLPYVRLAQGRR